MAAEISGGDLGSVRITEVQSRSRGGEERAEVTAQVRAKAAPSSCAARGFPVAEKSRVSVSLLFLCCPHLTSEMRRVMLQVQYPAVDSEWPEGAGSGRFEAEGSAALELQEDLPLALLIVLGSDLSARLGKPSVRSRGTRGAAGLFPV